MTSNYQPRKPYQCVTCATPISRQGACADCHTAAAAQGLLICTRAHHEGERYLPPELMTAGKGTRCRACALAQFYKRSGRKPADRKRQVKRTQPEAPAVALANAAHAWLDVERRQQAFRYLLRGRSL